MHTWLNASYFVNTCPPSRTFLLSTHVHTKVCEYKHANDIGSQFSPQKNVPPHGKTYADMRAWTPTLFQGLFILSGAAHARKNATVCVACRDVSLDACFVSRALCLVCLHSAKRKEMQTTPSFAQDVDAHGREKHSLQRARKSKKVKLAELTPRSRGRLHR